jgi:hypothetical protein
MTTRLSWLIAIPKTLPPVGNGRQSGSDAARWYAPMTYLNFTPFSVKYLIAPGWKGNGEWALVW